MIDDKRNDKTAPALGYVIATDTFMSGWGMAKGRSLFAVPVDNHGEVDMVAYAMRYQRTDMIRPRLVQSLRADGTPRVRMDDNDHLSVRDREDVSRFYHADFA